eukprot:gene7681-12147_t
MHHTPNMKLLLGVIVTLFIMNNVQANTPTAEASTAYLHKAIRGIFRCFVGGRNDFHVNTKQIRLTISQNQQEMTNKATFFGKICGDKAFNKRYMEQSFPCRRGQPRCRNVYHHNPYKCDCRALLYALKYNTRHYPHQFKPFLKREFDRLTNSLSRWRHQYQVTIPKYSYCFGWWGRRHCFSKELKPRALPFYDVFARSTTLLETDQEDELDFSKEFE